MVALQSEDCAPGMVPTIRTIDEPLIRNPWKRWAVVLGVWTFLTVFFVLQSITARLVYDEPLELAQTAGREAVYWYVWAALFVALVALLGLGALTSRRSCSGWLGATASRAQPQTGSWRAQQER